MTENTEQSQIRRPAPRRARAKQAGWKSGLMVAGIGAVVLGAGYLAGANAPAVGATGQSSGAQSASAQSAVLTEPQQAQPQDDQNFLGNDDLSSDNGNLSFDESGGNDDSAVPVQPRQFRRFRGDASGLNQFGAQQPQFRGPVTRSRGS